jgi:hypothetical protein
MKATFHSPDGKIIASFAYLSQAFACAHELLGVGDGSFFTVSHDAWDKMKLSQPNACPCWLRVHRSEGQVNVSWPAPVPAYNTPTF